MTVVTSPRISRQAAPSGSHLGLPGNKLDSHTLSRSTQDVTRVVVNNTVSVILVAPGPPTVDLNAAVAGIGTVVANLVVSRALATAIAGVGTVTPALADSRRLAATAGGTSTVTPSLKVSRALSTVVVGVGAVTPDLAGGREV